MSGHDFYVDTAVVFAGFMVWGIAYEAMRFWRRYQRRRWFNRDLKRVLMDAERYRKLAP